MAELRNQDMRQTMIWDEQDKFVLSTIAFFSFINVILIHWLLDSFVPSAVTYPAAIQYVNHTASANCEYL